MAAQVKINVEAFQRTKKRLKQMSIRFLLNRSFECAIISVREFVLYVFVLRRS